VTLSLDPTDVGIVLYPVENTGPLTVDTSPDDEVAPTPVDTEWGGGVVVQLPPSLDGAGMDVSLDLMPTADDVATRTYTTHSLAPNQLVVTPLGSGKYSVALPADDTINGPFGLLTFDDLGTTDPRFETDGPLEYLVQFTGTGVAVANLAPQILAVASLPCPGSPSAPCAPIPVLAGAQLRLTVPPTSLLRTLGLGTLDQMGLGLDKLDADGFPTGADTTVLTDNPALVSLTDSYNATVTLPASTPSGSYGLTIVQTTGSAGAVSITFGELQVRHPAKPRLRNAGLVSNTGWGETVSAAPEAAPAGASEPVVATGAGMIVLAGVVVAGVHRGRRRDAATACGD
jgi:hypothetical protein